MRLQNLVESRIIESEIREYFKKAIKTFKKLKQKKSTANAVFEYGKFLKQIDHPDYKKELKKAMKIFNELKLKHRVEEIKEIMLKVERQG